MTSPDLQRTASDSVERRPVVAVTGAAGGIGLATARRLAAEDARLALADLKVTAELEALAAERPDVWCTAVDVSDRHAAERFVHAAEDHLGRLDVLVTCAGILRCDVPAADVSWRDWDDTLAVNLTGTWACIRAALPGMIARGSGRIITISSELALTGGDQYAAYCASKGAVVGLTKALGRELAPYGVLVNSVAPGPVETPLIEGIRENTAEERARLPLRRFGRPEEIAATIAYLVRDTLMVGQVLSPNGGAVI